MLSKANNLSVQTVSPEWWPHKAMCRACFIEDHMFHTDKTSKVWWSGDHVRTKHRESTWNTVNSTSCHPKKETSRGPAYGSRRNRCSAVCFALSRDGPIPFLESMYLNIIKPTRNLLYEIFNIWQWFRYTAPLNAVHRTMDPTAALFSITARDGLGCQSWTEKNTSLRVPLRSVQQKPVAIMGFFPIISYLPIRRCSIQSW